MSIKSEVYLRTQVGELWIAYFLYFMFFTAPLGLLFNLFKIAQYRYLNEHHPEIDKEALDIIASHHAWLIRTFIVTLVLAMAALGTIFYVVGYFIALAALAWWLYRLGRGVIYLIDSKATPVTV